MMCLRLVVRFTVVVSSLYVCVPPILSQTVNGTILGVVRDQQGAVVPNATVSARNVNTGAVRTASTNESGTYRISSVPAGPYEVTTSARAFETLVRKGIVVTVGGDISVDFSLTLGSVNEKVEVTAEAPQVDTSTAGMAGLVAATTVREMPLNGRDWLQLALLQPGALQDAGEYQADSRRAQRGNGASMSVSGGRITDNSYRIDGLVVNDYANCGPGSALRVNMGVEAIQEFSVLVNNYSAEYGRGSSSIVNAITKSGTNGVHGSAYWFIRNSALDARNFFDPQDIPAFHRDQYGGAVGGSIKRDKTFYFVNFERLGELKSLSSLVTTPSLNAHNGIVCANSACTQTSQLSIASSVKPYLSLFPNPNAGTTGDVGNFAFAQPRLGHENYITGRIDEYLTPSTTLTGSYTIDRSLVTTPDAFDLKLSTEPGNRQNVVLSLQHVFSAGAVNVARGGVTRTYAGNNIDSNPMNPALNDPSLGFLPGRNMGAILITGVSGVYSGMGGGVGSSGMSLFGYTAPQAYDDLSLIKGRHSVRVGFAFEREESNLNSQDKPNGYWTFPSVQSFLLGAPSQFAADLPGTDSIRAMRASLFAGYIQDDFRMTPNLTINLGLRYEMSTVVNEANGKLATLHNWYDLSPVTGAPYFHNPTLRNFAPRVGLAWDPFKDGKTAVRSGFGIFDVLPLPYLFLSRIPRSVPFYVGSVITNVSAANFPNNVMQLLTLTTARGVAVEQNPRRPYKGQWNLNIQRQLTGSMALTVGYVGSTAVHVIRNIDDVDEVPPSLATWNGANLIFPIPAAGTAIQRINPHFGLIGATNWDAHSSYHALQTNVVQRLARGLYYQIAFTYSKSIDNGTNTNSDSESENMSGVEWAFDPRINRAVSDFNIPLNFVANFQYTLPVPAALGTNHFSKTLFGGWQIGGIYTRQTGAPFSVKDGKDEAYVGNSQATGNNGAQFPNFLDNPGCTPGAVTGNINAYINTNCIAWPAPGVLGNLGRNVFHMPTFRDLDFSVFRNGSVWGERVKIQFRVEMFNILNNTNLMAVTQAIFNGNGQFLSNVGAAATYAPTVNTSRQIQFGLRFLF